MAAVAAAGEVGVAGEALHGTHVLLIHLTFEPPPEFWPALQELVDELPERISEYEELLTQNEIFVARTRNVGVISPEDLDLFTLTDDVDTAFDVITKGLLKNNLNTRTKKPKYPVE